MREGSGGAGEPLRLGVKRDGGREEWYDFKHAYFYFLSFFQFLFKQCGSLRARSVPRLMP